MIGSTIHDHMSSKRVVQDGAYGSSVMIPFGAVCGAHCCLIDHILDPVGLQADTIPVTTMRRT